MKTSLKPSWWCSGKMPFPMGILTSQTLVSQQPYTCTPLSLTVQPIGIKMKPTATMIASLLVPDGALPHSKNGSMPIACSGMFTHTLKGTCAVPIVPIESMQMHRHESVIDWCVSLCIQCTDVRQRMKEQLASMWLGHKNKIQKLQTGHVLPLFGSIFGACPGSGNVTFTYR